jgi:hypothetical protein
MIMRWMNRFFCLTTVLLFLPTPLHADESLPTNTLLPGGVADPVANVGFVQHTDGGIIAFDLKTGKTLWNLPDFGRPVALKGNQLLVLGRGEAANRIQVLFVDTNKRELIKKSDPITFPDWVSVPVDPGRYFKCETYLDEKAGLVLAWEARASFEGRGKPKGEDRLRKYECGLVRVNLDSGKVEMSRLEKAFPLPHKVPKGLEKLVSKGYSTRSNGPDDDRPLVVGKKLVVLRQERALLDNDELFLDSYDLVNGKKLPPIRLMNGIALLPMLSSDGKKLFVHQALSEERLPAGEYAWWVFDLQTGKQLAKLRYDWAYISSRNLVDGHYFVLLQHHRLNHRSKDAVQRVLRAIDVMTGRVIWERALWAPPSGKE